MNFKKWVKSIQAAAYNGARTVIDLKKKLFYVNYRYTLKSVPYQKSVLVYCIIFACSADFQSNLSWRSAVKEMTFYSSKSEKFCKHCSNYERTLV